MGRDIIAANVGLLHAGSQFSKQSAVKFRSRACMVAAVSLNVIKQRLTANTTASLSLRKVLAVVDQRNGSL
ncbi:MAG: hypothetical protein R2788_05535 [Saprospiraceae bacterium]